MPQNLKIAVPQNTWTLMTNADVTSCTFQVPLSARLPFLIAGTVGAVPPASGDAAIAYAPGEGEYNISLTDMFPGIAATRLYVFSARETSIFVSHV